MKTRIVFILMTLLCASMASVQSARAATILVTNTNDSGPGSLRHALAVANNGDTIDATGVSGTISLTSGELQITRTVTINGPGAGTLAVNGNGSSRVFENLAGLAGDVTISGFTITHGRTGIHNFIGKLTVSNCTISNNFGGGISNEAGGYYATLTVSNSTINGNSANYVGGIFNNSSLTVSNSTISGNSANYGGGICNVYNGRIVASVRISNSTLSGNLSGVDGGGVYNSSYDLAFAVLIIENSTIGGNSATGHGGGIYNNSHGLAFSPGLALGSTILNAGASGGTISNHGGRVTSLGYNLASDGGGGVLTGPGDQINTNPLLGPLQDNGGPTLTQALLLGSPAINAGDPTFTPPPLYDQRGPGFDRVRDGRIDVGSFEVQAGSTPTPPPPTAHPATYIASNSFTASWSSVLGATGYRLDVSTNSSFSTYVPGYQNLNVGNATSRSVSGLNPSTMYHYRVRAYNGHGPGGNSNIVSVTTLSPTGPPVAITNPASYIASFSASTAQSIRMG